MDEFTKELKECAAGLSDSMGGHADYCAELMERAALMIAKLQSDYTAQSLALKAAKAMQQAETERADENELDAEQAVRVPDEMPLTGREKWTLGEWCEHFGGRYKDENPLNYYEFGSMWAISKMMKSFSVTQQRIGWNACRNAILSAHNHATIQPLSTKE